MSMDIDNMSVLDRRRIEAMVLGPMIRAFQEEIGVERANAVARRVMTQIAQKQGAEFADRIGRGDLESFAKNKDAWRRNGALQIKVLSSSKGEYAFDVTRCRYAEMYRELGYGDLGEIFSCTRDFEFSRGFNPDVTLTRTQTIMNGASHCDFRYRLTSNDNEAGDADKNVKENR
ncbi:MAG: L-2-amino-thiazoline-4-carboxylic acid hydrolase [Dehalococcoidia bacterium]